MCAEWCIGLSNSAGKNEFSNGWNSGHTAHSNIREDNFVDVEFISAGEFVGVLKLVCGFWPINGLEHCVYFWFDEIYSLLDAYI